jgi:glycosyltransferase involved in cell wall biosynthesis
MASVVVAAHDEAAVIGRCLDALLAQDEPVEITVVANGCRDATADVARQRPVRVLDLPEPGKARALNQGDAQTDGFPRLYLDADIVLPQHAVRTLVAALRHDERLQAVVPARRLAVSGRPWPVRCWAAVNQRLPVYDDALFGRGAIMLSEAGRSLFTHFPEVLADDLFLDGVVPRDARRTVPEVEVLVETPYRTADLLSRLTRVRKANAQMRAGAGRTPGVRPAARGSWLRAVVLPRPWLLPAGVVYAALTAVAAYRARGADPVSWGRDESTRSSAAGRDAS